MNKVNLFYSNQTIVDSIDLSVPCVVMLSGLRSDTPKEFSKNCLCKIDKMLQQANLKANVCGTVHDLSFLNANVAKIFCGINDKIFNKYKNVFVFGFHFFVPGFFRKYANRVFDLTILPRIVDEAGNPQPVEKVKDNFRKIVFLAHCYGIRMASMLDDILTKKLRELNYSQQQADDIQKQLVFIVESPSGIFTNIKATHIKFASLSDELMRYKDLYSTDNNITYNEQYNIIITPRMYKETSMFKKIKNIEHSFWPLSICNDMTQQGKMTVNLLNKVFYNALTLERINGLGMLVDMDGVKKATVKKTMMKFFEKIPTQKVKNIVFVSYSVVNSLKKTR